MQTPASVQAEQIISGKFPGTRFGHYNCRAIAGSSSWSQHSWNNALDIYPPKDIPYLASNDGAYRAYLDEVYAFIETHLVELNVRVHLWQVTNHYNHIHIDFWPRGWGTPPCAGGAERYKYPDATVKIGPPTLIYAWDGTEEPDMNMVAFVNAAFDSGNPAVKGDRDYWLTLAETDPRSAEFYDLFKAALTPAGLQDGAVVTLQEVK